MAGGGGAPACGLGGRAVLGGGRAGAGRRGGGRRFGAGGRNGQAALLRCSGNGGCSATSGRGRGGRFYSALSRHGLGRDSAAPRSVARQALPRQRSATPVPTMSVLCRGTMHDAAQAFGRARTIGAAKSVSFLKKPTVLDFKLVSKKC